MYIPLVLLVLLLVLLRGWGMLCVLIVHVHSGSVYMQQQQWQ